MRQVCAVARDVAADDTALDPDEESEAGFSNPGPSRPSLPADADLAGGACLRSKGDPSQCLGSPRQAATRGGGDAPVPVVSRFAFAPPRALRSRYPAANPTDSETCTASELGELGWRGARPPLSGRRTTGPEIGLGFGLDTSSGFGRLPRSFSFGAFGSGAGGDSGLGSDSEGETDTATSASGASRNPKASPGPHTCPAWLRPTQLARARCQDSEAEDVIRNPDPGSSPARSALLADADCGARFGAGASAGPYASAARGGALVPGCAQPSVSTRAASTWTGSGGDAPAEGSPGGAPTHAATVQAAPLPQPKIGLPQEGSACAREERVEEDGYEESSEDSDNAGARGGTRRWGWLGRASSGAAQSQGSSELHGAGSGGVDGPGEPADGVPLRGAGLEGGVGLGLGWLQAPSLWQSVRQRVARRRRSQGVA